jgi:hypothetical protein
VYHHTVDSVPRSFRAILTQGGELKASIAFPALALFDLFRNPIRLIPDAINMLISANVAMNRLQAYLDVRPLLGHAVMQCSITVCP